jgi:hypothetical protein
MSHELKSTPPDPDGMRARLDAAMWRWVSGAELTVSERRMIDMHMHAGGCHACD